jgi:hypothetical protein
MLVKLESSETDSYTAPTPFEVFEAVESLRPIRRRSRLGAIVLGTTVALGSILPIDIALGKASVENTAPIIHPIADAIEKDSTNIPVIYMDGFARQDSSWQARNMTDAIHGVTGSSIDALEYGEKGINANVIAANIVEHITNEGASSVSLYGYSIGGAVSLQVADLLINKYNVTVRTIFLDHTPADAESISSDGRAMGSAVLDTLRFFEDLGLELQYSSIARHLVNENIPGDMTYIKRVSSSVIIDQYTLGTSIDISETIGNLQSDRHPTPVIVYVSSSNPAADEVIDLVRSEQQFQQTTQEAGVPYVSLSVEGGLHGRPDLVIDSYEQVLPEARAEIDQEVRAAEALYRLKSGNDVRLRIFTP